MSKLRIKKKKTPKYKQNNPNELTHAQKVIVKFGLIVMLIVTIYGVLAIIDTIQLAHRASKASTVSEIGPNDGYTPAYDVEGMTDEQIEMLLQQQRNQNKGE